MANLTQQRCYHHIRREAVARCPECRRFFCRECVTEHEDRMLCSECLSHLTVGRTESSRCWVHGLGIIVQGIFGFALLWYAFYLVGLVLLTIPDSFHEGTIWQSSWWEQQ